MIVVALMALAAEPAPATVPNRDVVMGFAACVRRRAPDRAIELLRSEPDSDDERRKALVIAGAYNACILDRRALSFQPAVLRGQLAELEFRGDASLRERAAALPPAPAVKPDAAAIERAVDRIPSDRRDQAFAQRFRAAYAHCVADADPRGTAALLPTAPASAEERQAFLHYGKTLMRCMPEGISYHVVPAELRPYLVAELYYRAATAAPVGS